VTVYLVPTARGGFELYTEPSDGSDRMPESPGRIQRVLQWARTHWRDAVAVAERGQGTGRLARWRDRVIAALAESIAEQRTLWALGAVHTATLYLPASLGTDEARRVLSGSLSAARRYHARWLAVDLVGLTISGALAIVPGPNMLAYYFVFRVVGHLQSYRGARRGLGLTWSFVADEGLAELVTLVHESYTGRARRVEAIAARMGLPHLPVFFDRVATPVR
jgi:hypothetical protein